MVDQHAANVDDAAGAAALGVALGQLEENGRQRERRRGGAAAAASALELLAREPPLLGAVDVGVRAADESAQPLVLGLDAEGIERAEYLRYVGDAQPGAPWRSSLRRCCAPRRRPPIARRLKEFGVGGGDQARRPRVPGDVQLASANPSTLAYLQGDEIGLDAAAVRRLISSYPQLVGLSLDANVRPTAEFLDALGADAVDALRRHPQILGLSLDANLKPTRNFWRIASTSARRWIASLLSASVERKLAPAVAFLRDEVGIADVGRAASAQPALLSLSVDANLRPKLAFLRELGMENLGEQLGAYPALLSLSLEQNLRPTAAALIDGGVLAPPDAALRPRHLAASLDARILPRLEYCQLLRELEAAEQAGLEDDEEEDKAEEKALTLAAVTTESDAAFSRRLGQPDEAFAAFKAARKVRKEAGQLNIPWLPDDVDLAALMAGQTGGGGSR